LAEFWILEVLSAAPWRFQKDSSATLRLLRPNADLGFQALLILLPHS